MPIYEYCCDKCSHTFELRQSFNDKPVAACPVCKTDSRRVISPAPIIFKGSGFYITDVKRQESACVGSDSKPGKKAETETEKKPEAEKKAETESSKEPAKEAVKSA